MSASLLLGARRRAPRGPGPSATRTAARTAARSAAARTAARLPAGPGGSGRAGGRLAGRALLLRRLLVALAPVVGDVEPRALEQEAGAAGGHALRFGPALGAPLHRLVRDRVEELERVAVLA